MANTIKLKRSSTANAVPTSGNLEYGELALNYTDGNLFFKTAGNAVTLIASTQTANYSGNVTGGNLTTAGQVSATGNVSGGNLNVTGNIVDTGELSIITGASGNVNLAPNGTNTLVVTTTGANITGTINVTGNVSANYYTGNGSLLTGVSPTSIANGNSNVAINSAAGNVTVGINGQANAAIISVGSLFVDGVFSSPKTVSANIQILANTNSMIVGFQVIDTGYTMTIPDSSTVYVLV